MWGRWPFRRASVPVSYDPAYRWPVPDLDARVGFEARRADFVAWYLLERRWIDPAQLHAPALLPWADAARVHTDGWLERLHDPEVLSRVFGIPDIRLPVDEILRTVRLVCGGTLAAARAAHAHAGPAINLAGGFHHAHPDRGGGLCALNDVAIAVSVLRADGVRGRIAVLDLDAHPPDGTAAALAGDSDHWIGSISGCDWGAMPGVDETVIPGADGPTYLRALDALLARAPSAVLTFVLAGGDVLAGDRLGALALDADAVAERDRRVWRHLRGAASVWLPAGGYHPSAWRLFARTAIQVAAGRSAPVPAGFDPLRARFGAIARQLPPHLLAPDDDDDDLFPFVPARHPPRLLGFYSASGLELALTRLGLMQVVTRLGYADPQVVVDVTGVGDRLRVVARSDGAEVTLVEAVLATEAIAGARYLYVHWLSLRHPRAAFTADKAQLPGQEVPGLGLAPEATELLRRMAARLDLAGVALRPAFFHVAWSVRRDYHFLDPDRQAQFLALGEALAAWPLAVATRLVADGRVRLDGAVYAWSPDPMVSDPVRDAGPVGDAGHWRGRFSVAADAPDAAGAAPRPPGLTPRG
jgi:acetoin utilization deacetylase AcuC-like enzyme